MDLDGGRRTEIIPDSRKAPQEGQVAAVATLQGGVELRATLVIPLSCDASKDSPLAVARSYGSGATLDFSYMRTFQG